MVTHQMEVVKEICEKVALLEDGILVAKGAVEEVFLKPGISIKKFLGEEENDTLPTSGVNIRILFPSKCSESAIITRMARELEIDFSIVGGKLWDRGSGIMSEGGWKKRQGSRKNGNI